MLVLSLAPVSKPVSTRVHSHRLKGSRRFKDWGFSSADVGVITNHQRRKRFWSFNGFKRFNKLDYTNLQDILLIQEIQEAKNGEHFQPLNH